jgi:hypothetical protein
MRTILVNLFCVITNLAFSQNNEPKCFFHLLNSDSSIIHKELKVRIEIRNNSKKTRKFIEAPSIKSLSNIWTLNPYYINGGDDTIFFIFNSIIDYKRGYPINSEYFHIEPFSTKSYILTVGLGLFIDKNEKNVLEYEMDIERLNILVHYRDTFRVGKWLMKSQMCICE